MGQECNYFAYLIRVAEIWEVHCWNNLPKSALGTSDLSKFINMKILKIKLEKETVSYNKIIGHSFSINIRISQPSKVMFTSALPRWTSLFSGWQNLMSTSKECINCIMSSGLDLVKSIFSSLSVMLPVFSSSLFDIKICHNQCKLVFVTTSAS